MIILCSLKSAYILLVLIELLSLGVTAEVLRANIGSKSAISLQRGPVDPKYQAEGVAPTNYSSLQKTRLNDLSYDIKIWTNLSSVLSQSTCLTDGRTELSSLDRVCIPCSAVKMKNFSGEGHSPLLRPLNHHWGGEYPLPRSYPARHSRSLSFTEN